MEREEFWTYMDVVAKTLQRVPLQSLTKLIVKFTITHDYGLFEPQEGSLVNISIEEVIHGLRDLELHMCYSTNRDNRQRCIPFLTEGARFPNEAYAFKMWKLIENAQNLECLTIKSPDVLEMDDLSFPKFVRLRCFSLQGICMSSENLLSILNQSAETLEELHLWWVQLITGTWKHVLPELRKFPRLGNVIVDKGGYSWTGASAHLAGILVRAGWSSL